MIREEKKKIPFEGSCCAVVTPFIGGEVDFDALGVLIDRQIAGETAALAVCGTTGEAPSLTDEEYLRVVEFAVARSAGKIPVIAGAGAASTRHAAGLAELAGVAGADAVLAVTPYYVKASAEGLIRHYREIAAAGLPVILYNVPPRTGMTITMPVYRRLADIPNIVGVKEASGNVNTAMELAYELGDRFALYSGCDEINLPLAAIGFDGFISVTANIVPDKVSRLWNLWRSGDTAAALALDRELYPLTKSLFSEVNPIPVKKMLAEMGLCSGELRLPLY
ncbi:MAG: 4-hydroxy-tetrahydrodipicolinate synthase [Clostridia bacterium]|nr:4-hydroxy-tetrahydrodipicolinate synthase [Clostridia bacterium]